MARQRKAGPGKSWCGMAWHGRLVSVVRGGAALRLVWSGSVRQSWRGEVWRGLSGLSKARLAGQSWCGAACPWLGMARLDLAAPVRQGEVRLVLAGHGSARQSWRGLVGAASPGPAGAASLVKTRHGWAGRGSPGRAALGRARHGLAGSGTAQQSRQGIVGQVEARQGWARQSWTRLRRIRHGRVRFGEAVRARTG